MNIAVKKDILWVRWISNVYLKEEDFWNYNVKCEDVWYWWKIYKIKNGIKYLIDGNGYWKLIRNGSL